MFDDEMEWLFNLSIDDMQSGATSILCDWYYARINATGEGYEDDTPDSVFTGSWEKGTLYATGPGNLTFDTFWEFDGHQYAIGTLTWPSGEASTILLVRP